MINIYGYPFLVLFSFFLIYIGVIKALKFAGLRIRIFSLLIFFTLVCRYLSLTILMTCKNIIFLYLLKPFFYLNYLSIPILSMITLYIIMRNEKFDFKNIFVIALIFTLLYFALIEIMPSSIESSTYYGYKMYLQSPEYIYLFKTVINTLFLIFAVRLLDKSRLDKKGLYLTIIASTTAIVEIALTVLGIDIFQENILSDFLWLIVFIYALNKLKK